MSAADAYWAKVDATTSARARRNQAEGGGRWDRRAAFFRLDPRRQPDRNLSALMARIEPDDVVLDIGGGAGRVSLPIALKCREVVNVEPSPGMREQFEASAAEAGIANARVVAGHWPEAAGEVRGAVSVVANVTYFVREIVPFLEGLNRATSRLVIVSVWSTPPPSQPAKLHELVFGEPLPQAPSHRDLLPVLWEMGHLPEVQVLPEPFRARTWPQTREEAVTLAIGTVDAEGEPGARERVEAHFDTLFASTDRGFRPLWVPDVREMLISWNPSERLT
ncbi:MAG: class I SAM-dependent methyltransferase [Dehalococcoidia bacterium]